MRDGDAARLSAAGSLAQLWRSARESVVTHPYIMGVDGLSTFEQHIAAMSNADNNSYIARHASHSFGLPHFDFEDDANAARMRDVATQLNACLHRVTAELRVGSRSTLQAHREGHATLSADIAGLIAEHLDRF